MKTLSFFVAEKEFTAVIFHLISLEDLIWSRYNKTPPFFAGRNNRTTFVTFNFGKACDSFFNSHTLTYTGNKSTISIHLATYSPLKWMRKTRRRQAGDEDGQLYIIEHMPLTVIIFDYKSTLSGISTIHSPRNYTPTTAIRFVYLVCRVLGQEIPQATILA